MANVPIVVVFAGRTADIVRPQNGYRQTCWSAVVRVTCTGDPVTVWRRTMSVHGTCWRRPACMSTPHATRPTERLNLSSRKLAKLWSVSRSLITRWQICARAWPAPARSVFAYDYRL